MKKSRALNNYRHGHASHLRRSPIYRVWSTMKERCNNPNSTAYHKYGARGICVCQRWSESFAAFYHDMGDRPSSNHSIERKNNNLGYCPENCVWASRHEQTRNRRSNVLLTFYGKTMVRKDWLEISGVNQTTVIGRMKKGWSERDAVWTPVDVNRRNRRAVDRA